MDHAWVLANWSSARVMDGSSCDGSCCLPVVTAHRHRKSNVQRQAQAHPGECHPAWHGDGGAVHMGHGVPPLLCRRPRQLLIGEEERRQRDRGRCPEASFLAHACTQQPHLRALLCYPPPLDPSMLTRTVVRLCCAAAIAILASGIMHALHSHHSAAAIWDAIQARRPDQTRPCMHPSQLAPACILDAFWIPH